MVGIVSLFIGQDVKFSSSCDDCDQSTCNCNSSDCMCQTED